MSYQREKSTSKTLMVEKQYSILGESKSRKIIPFRRVKKTTNVFSEREGTHTSGSVTHIYWVEESRKGECIIEGYIILMLTQMFFSGLLGYFITRSMASPVHGFSFIVMKTYLEFGTHSLTDINSLSLLTISMLIDNNVQ